MKIVVTSLGESLESPLDERFGRARFFIVFEPETASWSVDDNRSNRETPHGAGGQAAERVLQLGAGAVITGHCGPNAFRALDAAGIGVYRNARGTVQDALNAYRQGVLEKCDQPSVDAGYGRRSPKRF